jgi:hypothetical protein
LPTNLTLEFTLKNARAWGMQEIMAKFNKGYLRSVHFTSKMPLSYNEINDTKVYATYSAANSGGGPGQLTSGTPPSSETVVSADGSLSSASIENVETVKAENNKVPLKGTKDDKGNLTFANNEKLVLANKGTDQKTVYETYTYVKNKDGGYTEYKSTKNKDKTWKNSSKIIEAGSVDANKLNSMFDSSGNIVSGAQSKMSTHDANSGISGISSDDTTKVKQDNAKKAASNPVVDKATVSDNNVSDPINNSKFKSFDAIEEKKKKDEAAKNLQNFQNLAYGNSFLKK